MIFGSYLYDVVNITTALQELKCPYTILGKGIGEEIKVTGINSYPYPVYVVDGLTKVNHVYDKNFPCVVIVCDAKSALLNSNVDTHMLFQHYTKGQLLSALKKALSQCAPQKLVISEPTLEDIIDKVTTKSILTDVQTLVNKVNPYDLRKKVHKYVISYLYGDTSFSAIIKFLNTASKLDGIKTIISSQEAKNMRNAVTAYIKCKDEEKVSADYGVHTFEILYVYNSYDRLKDEK